jgi:hypothetical protein
VKKSIRQFLVMGVAAFVLGALTPANIFAGVNVFAEGAYTATDLVVYIYADIGGGTVLRSAGVKLTYDPALSVTSAVKNGSVWALGSEAYMDPDTGTAGELVIILGKLDTAAPTAGVSGTRVLLGKVSFSHAGLTSFGLGLGLGKTGDFSNFVDTAATVQDGSVTFSTEVHKRGDANGDGTINVSDITALRYFIANGGVVHCWMNCNGDLDAGGNEVVNVSDITCVRYKMTNP